MYMPEIGRRTNEKVLKDKGRPKILASLDYPGL